MKFKLYSIILILFLIFSCTPDPCGDLYVRKTNPYLDEGLRTYIKSGDENRDTDQVYTGRCSNYTDGILSSIQQYKNGYDHGKWIFYFQNGNIETIGSFENGNRIGEWKYYFENKSLRRISFYNNGERDGVWFELNVDGDTLWTEDYTIKKENLN